MKQEKERDISGVELEDEDEQDEEDQEGEEDDLFPGGANWLAKFKAFAQGYSAGVEEGKKNRRW